MSPRSTAPRASAPRPWPSRSAGLHGRPAVEPMAASGERRKAVEPVERIGSGPSSGGPSSRRTSAPRPWPSRSAGLHAVRPSSPWPPAANVARPLSPRAHRVRPVERRTVEPSNRGPVSERECGCRGQAKAVRCATLAVALARGRARSHQVMSPRRSSRAAPARPHGEPVEPTPFARVAYGRDPRPPYAPRVMAQNRKPPSRPAPFSERRRARYRWLYCI